ncbi:AAA family ATPase [Kineococcus rhizosphaerae]|uniref:MoxR-like ATPase n=1 Tax=Kineococcus rhizosphaerae TaxID=559628 RepID=A0A2T0R876_9ACTN|nr:MoxR family ATPase [Kineococcus rhizosphaerae]PRY17324.1 MoxR-like ATPase [Kineococcus rhizosphaerae]
MSTPTPPDDGELQRAAAVFDELRAAFAVRVVGQHRLFETLVVTLVAGGHVLLESMPGLAKTTAASTLAHALGGTFQRVQCTPDLLPSDIVGTQVFDAAHAEFTTRLGPVHANVVLLDEINRASAKTQSAMLEAMAEHQVTIAGVTHPLPDPFLVVATQNPVESEGTYPLPEAQLDRFLLQDLLDYPAAAEEEEIVRTHRSGAAAAPHLATVALEEVLALRGLARRVHVDPSLVSYVVALVRASRTDPATEFGASPRASIALTGAAQARALLQGRDHVLPADVQALAHRALRHRVGLSFEALAEEVRPDDVVDRLLEQVPAP